MAGPKPYHGFYTASEYAIVKGQMLRRHQQDLSTNTVDTVIRYVAKHFWPNEREKCYLAAAQFEQSSRESSFRMLRLYDETQLLFDRTRQGDSYLRAYPAIPEVPEAVWELAPLESNKPKVSSV